MCIPYFPTPRASLPATPYHTPLHPSLPLGKHQSTHTHTDLTNNIQQDCFAQTKTHKNNKANNVARQIAYLRAFKAATKYHGPPRVTLKLKKKFEKLGNTFLLNMLLFSSTTIFQTTWYGSVRTPGHVGNVLLSFSAM